MKGGRNSTLVTYRKLTISKSSTFFLFFFSLYWNEILLQSISLFLISSLCTPLFLRARFRPGTVHKSSRPAFVRIINSISSRGDLKCTSPLSGPLHQTLPWFGLCLSFDHLNSILVLKSSLLLVLQFWLQASCLSSCDCHIKLPGLEISSMEYFRFDATKLSSKEVMFLIPPPSVKLWI